MKPNETITRLLTSNDIITLLNNTWGDINGKKDYNYLITNIDFINTLDRKRSSNGNPALNGGTFDYDYNWYWPVLYSPNKYEQEEYNNWYTILFYNSKVDDYKLLNPDNIIIRNWFVDEYSDIKAIKSDFTGVTYETYGKITINFIKKHISKQENLISWISVYRVRTDGMLDSKKYIFKSDLTINKNDSLYADDGSSNMNTFYNNYTNILSVNFNLYFDKIHDNSKFKMYVDGLKNTIYFPGAPTNKPTHNSNIYGDPTYYCTINHTSSVIYDINAQYYTFFTISLSKGGKLYCNHFETEVLTHVNSKYDFIGLQSFNDNLIQDGTDTKAIMTIYDNDERDSVESGVNPSPLLTICCNCYIDKGTHTAKISI